MALLNIIRSSTRLTWGSYLNQQLHRYFQQPIPSHRGLLTSAFACPEAWQARLSAAEFSGGPGGLSGLDLGNGLMRALDRREPVAAVDIDVYANKLDAFDLSYLAFFASVLAKFRATQYSLSKLASTDHALVRCMLSMGQAELLVEWLRDKFTYGIFLDQYSASLLIDHLLEAGNSRLAALVSFDHALQESPSDGRVCTGLMLLACVSRAASQLPDWCAINPAAGDSAAATGEDEEADDDPDTKHVIVDYIRLPNYDGHFDLDEERLQIGHTLVSLSRHLAAEQPSMALTCALIGLAAEEKPGQLVAAIRSSPASLAVSRSTVEAADALLASARLLSEGEAAAKLRGRRPRCRLAEVEAARAALRSLPTDPDQQPWHEAVATFARRLVSSGEAQTGQQLAALYAQFAATRLEELRRHGDWLRRQRLFRSVKQQLDSLVEEQEALTAFDNAAEIRYAAWSAPRTRAERRVTTKQIWDRDVANANRLLDEASEAASRGGSSAAAGKAGAPALLRRPTSRKEKFRPLKE